MTIPLTNQIEQAEHGLDPQPGPSHHAGRRLRLAGARAIRSGSRAAIGLADRLDPAHHPA